MTDPEQLALVLVPMVTTGFCTHAEYALVTTRSRRMEELADAGDHRP